MRCWKKARFSISKRRRRRKRAYLPSRGRWYWTVFKLCARIEVSRDFYIFISLCVKAFLLQTNVTEKSDCNVISIWEYNCYPTEYSKEDAQLLALDSLKCCHHPLAMEANRRYWSRLVTALQLEPKKLVGQYSGMLKNHYIQEYTPSEVMHFKIFQKMLVT